MTSGLRPVCHAVALIKWVRGRECECLLRVNRAVFEIRKMGRYVPTNYRI